MNGNYSTAGTGVPERLPDSGLLGENWKDIDWKKAEREVNRLRARIARAARKKKWNTVKRLRYLLDHSFYAKAIEARGTAAEESARALGRALSDTIRKRGKAWNQEGLIQNLNRQIREWMEAYPFKEAKKAGGRLDYLLYEWLWRWAKRRHPRKGKGWILERYWHPRNGRRRVFSTGSRALIRIGH